MNNIIDDVGEYMLTMDKLAESIFCNNIYIPIFPSSSIENIIKETKNKDKYINFKNSSNSSNSNNNASNILTQSQFFIPKNKDNLFWIFYVIKNGLGEYYKNKSINIVEERKIKISYIDKLRLNTQKIRKNKCKPLYYLEDKLLNEPNIDINTFFALCVIEDIQFMYINKNTCYKYDDIEDDGDGDINKINNGVYKNKHIIHFNETKKSYEYEYDFINNDIIEKYNKYFKLDNLHNKIKAIGSYKAQDLIDICKSLSISSINSETGKHLTKPIIYKLIKEHI
jgi:hypothetical protein